MNEQRKNWEKFEAMDIPSSLELFPILYKYLSKRSNILDLGCGFGKTCFDLYKKGYINLFGIDVNKEGIRFVRKGFLEWGMMNPESQFKVSDAKKIPFGDAMFDCVITQAFWTSIMPEERKAIIKEIFRVLKKGGIMYIAQFAQTWRSQSYKKRYQEGIKKGYEKGTFEVIDKITGKVNYLAHHYTKRELEKLLKSVGFKIEHYSKEIFTTQSGNKINGHVIIAYK